MNTIKTVVVVTTLLAVGYGAHVVLNKPIPNGQFAEESAFPPLPGFDKPSLQIGSDADGPVVTLPPLQPLDPSSSTALSGPAGQLSTPAAQAGPGAIPNRFARVPSAAGATSLAPSDGSRSANLDGQTPMTSLDVINQLVGGVTQSAEDAAGQIANEATANLQNRSQQMAQSVGAAISSTVNQANASIGQTAGGLQHSLQNLAQSIPTAIGDSDAAAQQAGATNSRPYGLQRQFEEIWLSAQSKLQNGQLVDALLTLSMHFNSDSLTSQQREQLIPLLDRLAGSVIYSNSVHVIAPHQVQSGETIQSIAQSYNLTPEFLMRTNAMSSPMTQPGQTLKVVRGPFRGELSIANRELTLFVGRYYAGRFPVAIGRDLPAQASILEVTNVAGPQPYADPRTGEQVPAGDGNNPYGNHWIGLRDIDSPALSNLALHSSGSNVAAADSRGCIGLSNEDADDLQAILSVGSRIQFVP